MSEFCPKCGTEKGPFLDGFCVNCYLSEHRLIALPGRLELQSCKKCGKIFVNRKWVSDTADNIAAFILSKAKWANIAKRTIDMEIKREDSGLTAVINVSGTLKGVKLSAQYKVFIVYKNRLCDSCLKLSSSYYEAILQLRFPSDKKKSTVLPLIEHFMDALQSKDPLARIVRTAEMKTGIDLFIGSNKAAKLAVKELKKRFNASIKRTSTLTGITRAGKKKVKYTYLVRVP